MVNRHCITSRSLASPLNTVSAADSTAAAALSELQTLHEPRGVVSPTALSDEADSRGANGKKEDGTPHAVAAKP